MGNQVWVIHCEHNTQYEDKQKQKYTLQKTKMMCSSDPIKYRGNQEWAHWAHTTQYEHKQTYTTQNRKLKS